MHIHSAQYHRELKTQRKKIRLPLGAERLLAVLEGVEGGFAIGAGLIAGLAFATTDKKILLMTAIIGLLVSGFNSSAVKYSSEHYQDELDGHEKRSKFRHYFIPALLEFVAYSIISVLTLIPLIIAPRIEEAVAWVVVTTLITLYAAGYWRGFLMRRSRPSRDGLEIALLGAAIIIIGALSGYGLHAAVSV